MNLRTKTLAILGAALTAWTVIAVAVSSVVLLKRFDDLEEDRMVRNVLRAEGALKGHLEDLDRICKDWGAWNETYAYAETGDPKFLEENVNDQAFLRLRIDFVAFVHRSGRLLSLRRFDRPKGTFVEPAPDLLALFSPPDPALTVQGDEGGHKGIVALSDGPYLVSARPLLKGDATGPMRGTLVMGRRVGAPDVGRLAALTHLEIAFSGVEAHPHRLAFQKAEPSHGATPSIRVNALDGSTIMGLVPLEDIWGRPRLLLTVSMPRDIHAQALATVLLLALCMVAMGTVTVLLLHLLISRLVLKPVSRLAREVAQHAPGLLLEPPGGGPDEVQALSETVRRTFRELEQARQALEASRADLERQVEARTAELEKAYEELLREVGERRRAADALQLGEERYRSLVENVNEIIYSIDQDGRITYLNPVFERVIKAPVAEALGKHFGTFVHPEDLPALSESAARTMAGHLEPWEFRVIDSQGQVHLVRSSSRPIVQEGKARGLIGVITDLTTLKRTEEKLRRITEAFLAFSPDPGENIRRLTALAGELLGADSAVYHRLDGPMLTVAGDWNVPADYPASDRAEGRLCLQTIQGSEEGGTLLRGLPSSPFALTDPAVLRYGLQTYFGSAVSLGGRQLGSLCVLFFRDWEPEEEDRRILGILAAAVGVEEERRHQQQSLQESERRFKAIFEHANDAIFLARGNRLADCNPKAVSLFGYPREAFSRLEPSSLSPPHQPGGRDSRKILQEKIGAALAGHPQIFDWQHRRADGSLFDAEVTLSRVDLGFETLTLGIVRDVTDRKQAEERLRASEERFRRLVEVSPDAIFIHEGGQLLFCNSTAARLLGAASPEQLVGTSIMSAVHPEYREAVRERVRLQLEEGRAVPLLEEKFIRVDGTPVDVEVAAVPSEFEGRKASYVVVRDITERRRAEAVRRATYQISEAAISARDLKDLFAAIHSSVAQLMDAHNFYIALYEPERGVFSFPYWLDEFDPAPDPEPPGRGLTAYVFRTGKPLLASPQVFAELVAGGEVEAIGAPSIDWLGVPLKAGDKTIGVLVVQSYHEGTRYGAEDLEILTFVSGQVAMAIERRRAEEALRRSEEKYRALVENQGEGVIYVAPDETVTFANPAADQIFGMPPGGLVGHNVLELTSPEAQAEARDQGVRRRNGERSTYETEIVRPDGQKRKLLLTAVPRFGASGSFEGNLAVFFDITGRLKTEVERQLLTTAIEQSGEGILVTDPEGTILYANRAMEALTGYKHSELLGQNPRILKSGQQDQAFYQSFWRAVLAGRMWSGRFVNRKKGGELYTAETVISPVKDPAGQLTAFVCSQRDVTREIQWEEELQRARRLETIGLLAGVVAHEVRNPLFAISTLCAALDKNLGDEEQFKPFTSRIQEQVKKLSRLMKDLLLLGRPPDMDRFVPCSIREILEEGLRGLVEAGECSADRFVVDAPEDLPDLRGLPDRLTQVFQNLALNALHHSPPDAQVHIGLRVAGTVLVVAVSDSGAGLPQDLGLRVFEPFQSRRSGGTGLGLAVVRQIVEAHGGTVDAVNNDPGPGATFTLTLPIPQLEIA